MSWFGKKKDTTKVNFNLIEGYKRLVINYRGDMIRYYSLLSSNILPICERLSIRKSKNVLDDIKRVIDYSEGYLKSSKLNKNNLPVLIKLLDTREYLRFPNNDFSSNYFEISNEIKSEIKTLGFIFTDLEKLNKLDNDNFDKKYA